MFMNAHAFNQPLEWSQSSNLGLMTSMFEGAISMDSAVNFDTSNVTDMSKTFSSAQIFDQDISEWDVSKVTSTKKMFESAYAFNSPLPQDWTSLEDMEYMFKSASSFNQPINWTTPRVTSMLGTFQYAILFDQDITWDTSQVTTMVEMFAGYDFSPMSVSKSFHWNLTAINALPYGNTALQDMFLYCNHGPALYWNGWLICNQDGISSEGVNNVP
jgi:hypothetical protein